MGQQRRMDAPVRETKINHNFVFFPSPSSTAAESEKQRNIGRPTRSGGR